ncbi:MAG TPA: hypothetical protein VHD36_02685 [Pirellulales bacterium]|nr:hypothetical protein [Pirellulales bacterium]
MRHYRWCMVLGAILLVVGVCTESFGAAGIFLVALGACGATFQRWRREPGLWMLALVFLALFGPTYLAFAYHLADEMMRGVVAPLGALDFVLATVVQLLLVRTLLTIARFNFLLSRRLRMKQPNRSEHGKLIQSNPISTHRRQASRDRHL